MGAKIAEVSKGSKFAEEIKEEQEARKREEEEKMKRQISFKERAALFGADKKKKINRPSSIGPFVKSFYHSAFLTEQRSVSDRDSSMINDLISLLYIFVPFPLVQRD